MTHDTPRQEIVNAKKKMCSYVLKNEYLKKIIGYWIINKVFYYQ